MHGTHLLTREARDADHDGIAFLTALYCAKYQVPPDESVAKNWRVREADGRIVGCYSYSMQPGHFVIHDFYIEPGKTGRRAASEMWTELQGAAGENTLVAPVLPGNVAQRAAMERRGWEPTAIIYTYSKKGGS